MKRWWHHQVPLLWAGAKISLKSKWKCTSLHQNLTFLLQASPAHCHRAIYNPHLNIWSPTSEGRNGARVACYVLLVCQNCYWLRAWLKALNIALERKRQIEADCVPRCVVRVKVHEKLYFSTFVYGISERTKTPGTKLQQDTAKHIPVKNGSQAEAILLYL